MKRADDVVVRMTAENAAAGTVNATATAAAGAALRMTEAASPTARVAVAARHVAAHATRRRCDPR